MPIADAASLVARYGIEDELAQVVQADLVARAELGFLADPQLVIDLRTGLRDMSSDMPEIAMTESEAREFFVRQALVEDAQVLNDKLAGGPLAEVYGGQFIDHHRGGVLVVLAVKEQGAEQVRAVLEGELGQQLPHMDRIEVRAVAVSRRDLVTAREIVMSKVDKDDEGSIVTGALIEDSTNQIVLFVRPGAPDAEVAQWEARLKQQAVPYRIEERSRLQEVDGTLRSDSQVPPYSGGHGFVGTSSSQSPPPIGVDGQHCTMGFKAVRPSQPDVSLSLTAGHCWYGDGWQAPIDAKAYYNWHSQNDESRTGIGWVRGYLVTDNLDLSLITMASDTYPKIIVNAATNNAYRGVTAVTSYAPQGQSVCHVGAASDSSPCGLITDWDDSYHEIVTNINNVIGGDSGGPLYITQANLKAWATGITAGSDGSNTRSTNISRYLPSFCGSCHVVTE